VSTEAEDIGEDTAVYENLVRAIVNCRMCELAIAIVSMICKCSKNQISNLNLV
jgi:hypothetical protein